MKRLLLLLAVTFAVGWQAASAQTLPPAAVRSQPGVPTQAAYDAPGQPAYGAPPAPAYDPGPPAAAGRRPSPYSAGELVSAGHRIFGEVSQGLATVVEHAVAKYGLPNGYIVGQGGGGAFIAGARFGEGVLYTKNAGQYRVFWQGPSIGFDVGGNGNRTMMLVYNLPSVDAIYNRYLGVNGSAYVVAGIGMTVLSRRGVYVVPIVSGVGARLGINFGYLKFTDQRTWNPF